MKTGIRMIAFALIASIALLIMMSVMGRMNRSEELQRELSNTVESTLEHLMLEKTYGIADTQEFLADFMQALCYGLVTDSDVQVDVMGVDLEQGLLSVRVTECFKHPNGRDGKVSCERTVVLEHPAEQGI